MSLETRSNFGARCLEKCFGPAFSAQLIQVESIICLQPIEGSRRHQLRTDAFVSTNGTFVNITHLPWAKCARKSVAAATLLSTTF